jgi:vitamin B12 transporter
MTARPIAFVSALVFTSAANLSAQVPEDTTRLAPIVVTATRTPVAAASLANGVTVIEGDALRRAGVTTLIDALRTVPSLAFAQAGGYGAQTSLFLRGGESDHVRILVDGVPLNQAGGFIDLANLTTENVERIEVVRGPVSVLYGSDAMTGVVQVITRQGRGAARASAEARGGSYGSSAMMAGVTAGGRLVSFSAGVQREATAGVYAFNNDYADLGASGRLTWTPDDRSDIQLALRYRNGILHYPTDGSGAAVDSNQQQRSRQAAFSLDFGRRLTPRLEARALLGFVDGRDSTDDRPDHAGDTLGIYAYESRISTSRRTVDLRVNARVAGPLLVTIGAAADRESERSQNGYQSSFGPGSGTTDVHRTNRAFYTQVLAESGRLAIQAGARLDDNERFGNFATWRAGASLRLMPGTRLRANAGTAFKEPTFGENYSTGYSVGNPGLKPERTTSIEAGLEQELAGGRLVASATGFSQRFRDLIQYSFVTAQPTDPNFYNVASARSSGAELELRVAPARALVLSAQYTYLHTVTRDSGYDGTVFAPGKPLLRRPAYSGSVSAEWRVATQRSFGARVLYVGARDDLDFSSFPAARVTLADYGRLDLWGSVGLATRSGHRSVALTLRAENVTGARHQEVQGFRAPGRRVLAGARIESGR